MIGDQIAWERAGDHVIEMTITDPAENESSRPVSVSVAPVFTPAQDTRIREIIREELGVHGSLKPDKFRDAFRNEMNLLLEQAGVTDDQDRRCASAPS
jgi:hypothetical protein